MEPKSRDRAVVASLNNPKVSNAMSVVLDRIVDFTASSGPRCEFADVSLSLRLAGAPLIEAIKARMAPAGVLPSLKSVVGMDDDRRMSTLRRAHDAMTATFLCFTLSRQVSGATPSCQCAELSWRPLGRSRDRSRRDFRSH